MHYAFAMKTIFSKACAKIDFYFKRKIIFTNYFARIEQLPMPSTLAVIFLPDSTNTAGVAAPAKRRFPAEKG